MKANEQSASRRRRITILTVTAGAAAIIASVNTANNAEAVTPARVTTHSIAQNHLDRLASSHTPPVVNYDAAVVVNSNNTYVADFYIK